jgi:predicted RNase H-like nuclease (RuvC/YqgF family)
MGSTHTTAFEAQGTIKTLRQTIDTLEDELHKANSARRDAEAICETLETKSGAYGQTVRDLENGYAKSKEEWYQQTRAVTKKLQAATDKVDELKRSLLDADAEVGILKKQVAAEKEVRILRFPIPRLFGPVWSAVTQVFPLQEVHLKTRLFAHCA